MSNLNVRLLDLPTHSRQFDANCGKIRYVSDPLSKVFVVGFRMQVKTCFRTSGADLKQKLDLKPDAVIQSTKVAQITLYYHVTKKVSSLLELISHVISTSEYVLEND